MSFSNHQPLFCVSPCRRGTPRKLSAVRSGCCLCSALRGAALCGWLSSARTVRVVSAQFAALRSGPCRSSPLGCQLRVWTCRVLTPRSSTAADFVGALGLRLEQNYHHVRVGPTFVGPGRLSQDAKCACEETARELVVRADIFPLVSKIVSH